MKLIHTYDSSTKTLIWFHYSTGYRIRNPREGVQISKVFNNLGAATDKYTLEVFTGFIKGNLLTIRTKDNQ